MVEGDRKYLDVYVYEYGGSLCYALFQGTNFRGSGSTPTPRSSNNYWKEVRVKVQKVLNKNSLREISLHNGIAPPDKEWDNCKDKTKSISLLEHNLFLLNFDVNNIGSNQTPLIFNSPFSLPSTTARE